MQLQYVFNPVFNGALGIRSLSSVLLCCSGNSWNVQWIPCVRFCLDFDKRGVGSDFRGVRAREYVSRLVFN